MASDDATEVDLDKITDEATLLQLLDETEDFDERKMIRSRLREVQAENRAKREEMLRRREQEREDAIKKRAQEAAEQKKRTLAMYDQMAKSAPAGAHKVMDINIYKNNEASPAGSLPPAPRDLVEESIQNRQKEAVERKKRILAAYDTAAKSTPAGGAKIVDFDAAKTEVTPKPANVSARSKFQQLDAAMPKPQGAVRPANFRGPAVGRSATDIKEMLLSWCKSKTKEYDNVDIQNFSTSWADGLAFCALIHHFYPDAFDYPSLSPKNRRQNFQTAFKAAEERGDISPLLDVEDMVIMKKPDWKCVFTYVQSIYRHLRELQ